MQKFSFVLLAAMSTSSAIACISNGLPLVQDKNQMVNLTVNGLWSSVSTKTGPGANIEVPAARGMRAKVSLPGEDSDVYEVALVSQKRDKGGIISSTYDVTKTGYTTFEAPLETRRYEIKGSYQGGGISTRGGCGQVTEIKR